MTIFMKLGLGFGVVLTMFGITGALILWNLHLLRATDERVRDRVSVNEIALEYRHAAIDATLGASQFAQGNVMGEQRMREGTAGARRSRELLKTRLTGASERREALELERVEKLTVAATERVAAHVRARSSPVVVQQELAFLSARADALNIGLEALYDETREEVVSSMNYSNAIGRRVQTQTAGALLLCVLLSTLVSVAVFRSIARPLAMLDDGVQRIAEGDLQHSIPITSKDEIGKLTAAFNRMTAGLRRAMSALDGRNQDMRLVLDHVNQGLLTMDRDGAVSPERSAVVEIWLGKIPTDMPLWTHLEPMDPSFAASLQLGWESILEDFLPLEVTLDQMPRRCTLGGRHLELDYRPISEGDKVVKLLVVISDVSDRIAGERARDKQHEVMAIFQAIQRDKEGFLDFIGEGTELINALHDGGHAASLPVLKRQIHTLKGCASMFGIGSVSGACHALETRMGEEARRPTSEELAELHERWTQLGVVVSEMMGDSSARIEIDDDEYAAILDSVVRGRPRREIARMVAQWRMERVELRLRRFAEQGRALASRLDKAPVDVQVESGGIRLPRENFAAFWAAFVHAVRNAVDHGIEGPGERAEKGKAGPAVVTLRTRVVDDELSVEIADNGRGIDWARIAEKARQRDLPAETEDDLVQALFADGVSTAEALTDVSGRGFGMAALRDACSKMAGRIVIQSARGEGTLVAFRFPVHVMNDATVVEICSRPMTTTLAPTAYSRRVSILPAVS